MLKLNKIFRAKKKFILTKSLVTGAVKIEENTKIINSTIDIAPGSSLTIGKNCVLKNVRIVVLNNGVANISEGNIIDNAGAYKKLLIFINNGKLDIGYKNRLQCEMKVRFGGVLKIGNHNNINEGSDIRADEEVSIGDFNQISYKCVIWDTNTHNIYNDEKRRELTIKHYPKFGYEYERPKTAKIFIGSDCWIGMEASVLKGVTVKNSCIVGFKTILSNCDVEEGHTVVTEFENKIFVRKTI